MQWKRPVDELLGIQHTQSSLSNLLNAMVTKQVHCLQCCDELTKKKKKEKTETTIPKVLINKMEPNVLTQSVAAICK